MKKPKMLRWKIFLGAFLWFPLITSADLQIRPAPISAELTSFYMAPQLMVPQTLNSPPVVKSGQLHVNLAKKKLQLLLDFTSPLACESSLCLSSGHQLDIVLPLTQMSVDSCGVKSFYGNQDMRSRGGLFQSLKIAEHSESHCKGPSEGVTVVEYQVLQNGNLWTSKMYGKRLRISEF